MLYINGFVSTKLYKLLESFFQISNAWGAKFYYQQLILPVRAQYIIMHNQKFSASTTQIFFYDLEILWNLLTYIKHM